MGDKLRKILRWIRHQLYIRRFLLYLLAGVAVAVFGLVKLIGYFGDMLSSRNTNEGIREIYYAEATETPMPVTEAPETVWVTPEITPVPETPVITETSVSVVIETQAPTPEPARKLESILYPGNPYLKVDNRFKHLQKESKHIVGWLNIDRLIDEAVVQRDNAFYLDHDIYGKENVNGALFLDATVNLQREPFAYLVYGHNMKTGEKFGCLRNYENSTFYHSNPIISFDTMYESGRYVIFSVGNVSMQETDRHYADLYALVTGEIDARQRAIDALKSVSVHNCTIDVQPEDQFLLLITCVANDEERRIVAARRIRAGENEEELKQQVQMSGKW